MLMIRSVKAREVLDSRGNPTVEAEVAVGSGVFRAIVPSGASTGIHEALELRDKTKRYMGKGVSKAVRNINNIIEKKLIGKSPKNQKKIDEILLTLDGTKNKSRLGANAILAVSMACCRAGAGKDPLYKHIMRLSGTKKPSMPVPCFNVINGGQHAGNSLAMQEFMLIPMGARSFRESLMMGSEIYHNLKKLIQKKYGFDATAVGDEGGFAPDISRNRDALVLLKRAIKVSGYEKKVKLGMDIAASEFYKHKVYDLGFKTKKHDYRKPEELMRLYAAFIKKDDVISIEDPFDQDDWDSYTIFKKRYGDQVQIVGDDLLVTNPDRIRQAIEKQACNALLLKINQIGTITEAVTAADIARKAGWKIMVSHRSGETEDAFIADLAVGIAAEQIKSGAPCRSERLAKYNQLLRIEEELSS